MPTQSPVWRARYPRLASLMQDDPAAAKRNVVRHNLIVAGDLLHMDQGAERQDQVIEGNRTAEDLGIAEPLDLVRRVRRPADFAPVLRMLRNPVYDTMPLDRMDRDPILAGMGIGAPGSRWGREVR